MTQGLNLKRTQVDPDWRRYVVDGRVAKRRATVGQDVIPALPSEGALCKFFPRYKV